MSRLPNCARLESEPKMSNEPSRYVPSRHVPVLLKEIVTWLRPQPGQTLVDGTLGGGGHARELVKRVGTGGMVLGIDRDPIAIERTTAELGELAELGEWAVKTMVANFCDLPEVLKAVELEAVDGILLDLGLSSDQLADDARGFSFDSTGPLDLRFDRTRGDPAWKLVERLSAEHLADLIYAYGEERLSRRIARRIVQRREKTSLRRSCDLADVVRSAVPKNRKERIDAATRTFQALRIAVNDELKSLKTALRRLPDCLRVGGRLAIVSFHSLEDRPVKQAFASDDRLEVLTRKPIRATPEEVACNPRSRSAKLRVAERK